MTFIKTEEGNFVNVAAVHEAIVETDFVTLRLNNGATRRAERASWFQAFAHRSRSAFAALPGTYGLSMMYSGGDSFDVCREVVVGWVIGEADEVFVIMPSRTRALDHELAVLHPDGRVQDGLALYECYDEWYEDMLRMHFEPIANTNKITVH